MTLLVELARRAAAHPHAATVVKRTAALQNGQGEPIEVPIWGVVIVYLTILAGSIAFSLVSNMPFSLALYTHPRCITML